MSGHKFGGGWTDKKLELVRKYMSAYTTALKNTSYRRIYIDAFAGTGYRSSGGDKEQAALNFPEFHSLAKGSARIALEVQPEFDEYIFIEKNRNRFEELKKLQDTFPSKRGRMTFEKEDANTAIVNICNKIDWRNNRAVLFLDPYGMAVDWSTIEDVAATKAIDLWYLFPAGMGVDRCLTSDANISPEHRKAMNRLLGRTNWFDAFYKASRTPDLFGEITAGWIKDCNIPRIGEYFINRLNSIFPGVGKKGYPLLNSTGYCMYILFFACSNPDPRAKNLALKIANHILDHE